MKNKKFKSLYIPTSALSTILAVSPIAISSCTFLPTGQIDREEQVDLLSSELAKITLLDGWLVSTYSSLYAQNLKKDLDINSQVLVANTIKYYFDYLQWPTENSGQLVGSNEKIEFADETIFSTEEKTKFENNFKEAYKFLIQYRSTIATTSSDDSSTTSPITYFLIKSIEWQKNKFKTLVEIKDSETNKILTINDFNPGLNYTGLDLNNKIIENDFKILISTRGTKIFQDIMKMLLAEMYFMHSTETLVKNGTNFNKLTSKASSINKINTEAYVGDQNDFSTYLLKKYMVENSPQYTWSYTSEDYSIDNTTSSIISTYQEFNNLKTTKETKLSSTIAPNSTENESNSIINLQAFDSLSNYASSETKGNGDLSTELDVIKSFGDSKIGLLDTEKNMVFTFTELASIKEIKKYNQETTSNKTKLSIPSINIKDSAKDKNSYSITIEDIEVSWGNGKSTTSNNNIFTYTTSDAIQELKINSITYTPDKSTSKELNISFTYSFSKITQNKEEANSNKYSFDYNFNISNWGNETEGDQINEFANPVIFTGDPEQVGIKIFNDSESIGITYYLRTLPIFKKTGQISLNNKWYMTGKFTLEGTPWASEEEQKKLVYFYLLTDSNLYSQIQDFYLFNNFNITGNVSELTSQINSLGLQEKTDDDRRKQGIIF